MKPGDCTRQRRFSTKARREWYAFYRQLRHSNRLLQINTAVFQGYTITLVR